MLFRSRTFVHREPVIELCGADPYKFAELRKLGLINEQIDWKQRFFVPTDEEPGTEILAALLNRYPVLISDDASQDEVTEPEPASEMRSPQIVDLEQWIVAVSNPQRNGHESARELIDLPPEPTAMPDVALTSTATVFGSDTQSGLAATATQLGFDF